MKKPKDSEPKKIDYACDTKDSLPLEDFSPFQGNLKSLSVPHAEGLKKQILDTGFAYPIYVWKDPLNKTSRILGGHQRIKVLKELEEEGYQIGRVPVVYVKAKNLREAKLRVLQDVAQYGKIEGHGLDQFLKEAGLDFNLLALDFRFPDLNLEKFAAQYFPLEEPENPAKSEEDPMTRQSDEVMKVILFYNKKDYEELMQKTLQVSTKMGISNLSDLFYRLVNDVL